MNTALSSLIKSINANNQKIDVLEVTLQQFIENSEYDPINLQELCDNKDFPKLCQYLSAVIVDNPIPNPKDGDMPSIVTLVLKYLITLSSKHPVLLDIISLNSNLNLLIPAFFAKNYDNTKIISKSMNHLFLPLKFLAYIFSTQRNAFTSAEASSLLIGIINCLLSNPQVAAWAATVMANIAFSNDSFLTYVRQSPHFKSLKDQVTALITSSDQCAMIAGLALSVILFPNTVDYETVVSAAMEVLQEKVPFPLLPHLVNIIITKSVKKISCQNIIDSLLNSLLIYDSFSAYELLKTALTLCENGIFTNNKELIKKLLLFAINDDSPYLSIATSKLVQELMISFPNIFTDLDADDKIFKRCLRKFIEKKNIEETEKLETILVIMRCLFMNKIISPVLAEILQIQEENIFMQLMRNIESNNAYLSLQIFHFILRCASQFDSWSVRLTKVIIDSHFAALLAHILLRSSNKSATADAISALALLTNNNRNIFFDDLVGAFNLTGRQTEEEIEAIRAENAKINMEADEMIRKAGLEYENVVDKCNSMKEELSEERNQTKIKIESLSKVKAKYNDLLEIAYKQKQKIKATRKRNKELEIQLKEMEFRIEAIQTENDRIQQKLSKHKILKDQHKLITSKCNEFQKQNQELRASLDFANEMLDKKKKQIETLQSDNASKEETIASTQSNHSHAQDTISSLQKSVSGLSDENAKLKRRVQELQSQLEAEQAKNDNLETTNVLLRDEIAKLSAKQFDVEAFKAKYDEEKNKLKIKLINIERDRKKWETTAKFANRVGIVKNLAVHDVYGSVFEKMTLK
ncbi:hypothetical protein TVAG_152710 [Trichomonas vaginalis G3]|uniref:Uncharacterized protein n=1 Tax=Trichomonas vaginalis (strain ATCC PRA-98 / G3) TaxID=412133 RepID=A2FWL9_TRIV3|nr:A-type inclusion protein-related family [Trichomonas vaginalis G3]EAX90704.1 hypothetical protein TVAG_152710 [Trichomonas vaginalis G3]KAI5493035.1 A-type inclusion protein-related family [Trichomonas vaginalis G3]|eukprot:XP_001303634.1 hypothetical protein [Trichomonas vaginalis G3]